MLRSYMNTYKNYINILHNNIKLYADIMMCQYEETGVLQRTKTLRVCWIIDVYLVIKKGNVLNVTPLVLHFYFYLTLQ
jgi:hypothetical protein